jgi:hypothetical protein
MSDGEDFEGGGEEDGFMASTSLSSSRDWLMIRRTGDYPRLVQLPTGIMRMFTTVSAKQSQGKSEWDAGGIEKGSP